MSDQGDEHDGGEEQAVEPVSQLEKLRKLAKANEGRLFMRVVEAQQSGYKLDPPAAEEVERHRKLVLALDTMATFERLREMTRDPDAQGA